MPSSKLRWLEKRKIEFSRWLIEPCRKNGVLHWTSPSLKKSSQKQKRLCTNKKGNETILVVLLLIFFFLAAIAGIYYFINKRGSELDDNGPSVAVKNRNNNRNFSHLESCTPKT